MKKYITGLVWDILSAILIMSCFFFLPREYSITLLFIAVLLSLNLYLMAKIKGLINITLLFTALVMIALRPILENYLVILPPIMMGFTVIMTRPKNKFELKVSHGIVIMPTQLNYPVVAASIPFIIASPYIESHYLDGKTSIIEKIGKTLLFSSIYSIIPIYSILVVIGCIIRNLMGERGVYLDILLRIFIVGVLFY